MKLNLSYHDLKVIVEGSFAQENTGTIDIIIYDTRKINTSRKGVFFAFKGQHQDGHSYCMDAYEKGCRCFVLSEMQNLPQDACIILVEDTLKAFQALAKHHRQQFSYPVIAITGSFGKTILKESLYYLLKDDYKVYRSPQSFNSQIGVAHALLGMRENHQLAVIEADISFPDEMDVLEDVISPTIGVFTGLGSSYKDNFNDQNHHLSELLKLFKNVNLTFVLEEYTSAFRKKKLHTEVTSISEWSSIIQNHWQFKENKALALKTAQYFGVLEEKLKEKMNTLPTLPGRQEIFDGINNNLIINDTYNVDIDALEQALEYQFSSKEKSKKVVVLDLNSLSEKRKKETITLVNRYKPEELFVIENNELPEKLLTIRDAIVLFKSSFQSSLSQLVNRFKNKKHKTWVTFDMRAIRHNLSHLKSLLPPTTKTLVMVKASSYGSGDMKIPHFLQENSVDYLGVTYNDEGVTLRKNGIHLPILVINPEESAYRDCINVCLEPSLNNLTQIEKFNALCTEMELENYPIHINVETGMNRLGINESTLLEVIEYIKNQPSIKLKGVFSHLADADNEDQAYTLLQIDRFKSVISKIREHYKEDVIFHLLNSEGVLHFAKDAAFDMVRLGIGLFGYASVNKELKPSIEWKTTISQVKTLKKGDTVGYGRQFTAGKDMKIATINVGYADGFRRFLSKGKGQVYINKKPCFVVGNICMDMTMVDVSNVECREGDEVEIIGQHQTMQDLAKQLNSIPYEVMTGINKRVVRVYVQS